MSLELNICEIFIKIHAVLYITVRLSKNSFIYSPHTGRWFFYNFLNLKKCIITSNFIQDGVLDLPLLCNN